MRYDKEDLQAALRVLRQGGIIVYPTDTVWGIGCDATNSEAVARIYALKKREDSKSMLVLLDSAAKLNYYVDVPESAELLLESVCEEGFPSGKDDSASQSDYSPAKPLTIIYPNARHLAPNLIAEDGSLGVRITKEPFSKELCYRFQKAIVSTSANISGEPAAQNYCDIDQRIIDAVDYVCWSRRQEHKPHTPSSIIKLKENGEVTVIRK